MSGLTVDLWHEIQLFDFLAFLDQPGVLAPVSFVSTCLHETLLEPLLFFCLGLGVAFTMWAHGQFDQFALLNYKRAVYLARVLLTIYKRLHLLNPFDLSHILHELLFAIICSETFLIQTLTRIRIVRLDY